MAQDAGKRAILWFRKGLRLHDNPALMGALKDNPTHLYPIFIIDPWFMDPQRVGVNRLIFLLESLTDLQKSFEARGSRLLVLKGRPSDLLPQLASEWGATHLYHERDTEPYAKARDEEIRGLMEGKGVTVEAPVGHTLYDLDLLWSRAGKKLPMTMQAFQKVIDKVAPPQDPVGAPGGALPGPKEGLKWTSKEEGAVPTLAELKYPEVPEAERTPFRGGETEALARLERYMARREWVCAFEKPKTDPSAFIEPATTVLSPHLKFGTLSPRLFHKRLVEVYRASNGKHSVPPVSLRGQLLFRELFYLAGHVTPNFDKMEGNAICKQIPWDKNEEFLSAWENSRTGYPWIDAIMAQLRTQGWMHHLARHCVACFLTRGDLYVSWERGRDVFDRYLLDADWSLNNANWMWLSASSFFYQFMRVYSPISFGKKYDPEGKYVRRFLPVLKDMPSKYIYEPWTAPLEVQKKANCIIGKDYPKPIVDHATIHKVNIGRHAAAYKAARGGAGDAEDDDEEEEEEEKPKAKGAKGKRKGVEAGEAPAGKKKGASGGAAAAAAAAAGDGKVQTTLTFGKKL